MEILNKGFLAYKLSVIKKLKVEKIIEIGSEDSHKIPFIDRSYMFNMSKKISDEKYDLCSISQSSSLNSDLLYSLIEELIRHCKYIVIDEFYLNQQNMLSINFVINKYSSFIQSYTVHSEYNGVMVITLKADKMDAQSQGYLGLQTTYDTAYYLEGCGGYEEFLKHNGQYIEDTRILSAYYLANISKNDTILDVGSGRGELSYLFSKNCKQMIGLDYSQDAIDISKKTYKGISNLKFVQGDILKYKTEKLFDKIVATDVVEHIEEEPLELAFENIKTLLKNDGLFIVHTAPNKLNYMYDYQKKYEKAQEIGTYLPKNPRSYYEEIMHINEQTPAQLKRSLKKYFKNVIVWTTSLPDIKGNLGGKILKTELEQHTSIFAIATDDTEFSVGDILPLITQEIIMQEEIDIHLKSETKRLEVNKNKLFYLDINVSNKGAKSLKSLFPSPVHIAYHWRDKTTNEYVVYDGLRTKFNVPLLAKQNIDMLVEVMSPEKKGDYLLEITLVQEGQFWFEEFNQSLPLKIEVNAL